MPPASWGTLRAVRGASAESRGFAAASQGRNPPRLFRFDRGPRPPASGRLDRARHFVRGTPTHRVRRRSLRTPHRRYFPGRALGKISNAGDRTRREGTRPTPDRRPHPRGPAPAHAPGSWSRTRFSGTTRLQSETPRNGSTPQKTMVSADFTGSRRLLRFHTVAPILLPVRGLGSGSRHAFHR